jgi:pyruvate formate lyase activating enzyme
MAFLFDLKRYSINDGPGIRITLFFKGCPLSCSWCHNPEGVSLRQQKMYARKKCIGCGACTAACPESALRLTSDGIVTDTERCLCCGSCAEACPAKAMEMAGTEYTADYLMQEIEKETLLMDRSGGGVTFCGGEPLLHPEALSELLRRCGALDIHRAVDTSLYAEPDIVRQVMRETDLFLIDLKTMDRDMHKTYCGASNDLILHNIRMTAKSGKDFIIRIPLIEGFNADEENITRSAAFLGELPWARREVHLLPYHAIAAGKYEKLGVRFNPSGISMSAPSPERRRQCVEIFKNHGIKASI